MSKFDEREKAFEGKYKLDQERAFKANARRCKLIGLWAAEKMGIAGDAADAYAKEVVISDFEKPGQDDVVEKLVADFASKGVDISEHVIRVEMDRCFEEAVKQISEEES
ncbi:MAG: DUF1476 domain-containing protein [Alphaproteobacteria bacterium]|jgi:hypothetical protein|nr:DUF1476 domain-containing protein [Alphaproteobacteria bacterium]